MTRGVLLDMAALRGVETVPAGTAYNRAEIDAAVKRQGTPIRQGDVVLFHSGWHAMLDSNPDQWWQVQGVRMSPTRNAKRGGLDQIVTAKEFPNVREDNVLQQNELGLIISIQRHKSG